MATIELTKLLQLAQGRMWAVLRAIAVVGTVGAIPMNAHAEVWCMLNGRLTPPPSFPDEDPEGHWKPGLYLCCEVELDRNSEAPNFVRKHPSILFTFNCHIRPIGDLPWEPPPPLLPQPEPEGDPLGDFDPFGIIAALSSKQEPPAAS